MWGVCVSLVGPLQSSQTPGHNISAFPLCCCLRRVQLCVTQQVLSLLQLQFSVNRQTITAKQDRFHGSITILKGKKSHLYKPTSFFINYLQPHYMLLKKIFLFLFSCMQYCETHMCIKETHYRNMCIIWLMHPCLNVLCLHVGIIEP